MNLIADATRRRERYTAQSNLPRSSGTLEEFNSHKLSADLSKQITRRWKAGDVYAPHDLSEVEMAKWKTRGRPLYDVFDVLDLNPLDHYRVRPTSSNVVYHCVLEIVADQRCA